MKARGIRRAQASLAVLLLLSASFAGAEPYAGRPTFQDAVALFYAGEYARSRDAFEAFLTLQPRSPLRNRVPYWLGAISLGMGDYDSALEGFNRAAFDGEDPPFYPWHSKLLAGIALEELGREGEAAALYRALLETPDPSRAAGEAGGGPRERTSPWKAEALFRLAGIEYRNGGLRDARDLYAKVVIDCPDSPLVKDALFFLAEAELALGNTEAAEKRYSSLLSLYPGTPYKDTAGLRLAQTAAALGRTDESLGKLDSLLSRHPEKTLETSALRLEADLLFDRREFEAAAGAYSQALQAAQEGWQAQGIRFELGISLWQAGKKAQAVEALREAARGSSPEIARRALRGLGNLLAELGRDEEAVPVLASYCERYPSDGAREDALALLAAIFARGNDPRGEKKSLDSLILDYPGSSRLPEYLYRRGLLSMDVGNGDGALADLQRLLEEFPDSGYHDQASYAIGSIYAEKGEFIRALPYFRSIKGSAGAGELAQRTLLALGSCSFNLGNYPEALSCFDALIREGSGIKKRGSLLLDSAMALYRMQRLEEAAERLQGSLSQSDGQVEEEALYWLGWCRFRLGDFELSREAFLAIPEKYPSSARAGESLLRAALCAVQLGNDGDAVRILDRLLSRAGEGEAGRLREVALYEKAWALNRMGRTRESDVAFTKLEEEFPGGKLHAEALFKRAAQAMERKLFPQAMEGFQSVVLDYPSSPLAEQALYWSAEAAWGTGSAEASARLFWQYLVRYPEGSFASLALEGLGRAVDGGPAELARELAGKCRTAEGPAPYALSSIELDCAQRLLAQSPEESLELIQDAISRPASESLLGKADFLTARYHALAGEREKAIAEYRDIYGSRADRLAAKARLECARLLETMGGEREAFDTYVSLYELFPAFPDLAAEGLYNAVRISRAAGEPRRGAAPEAVLRKAYPDSPWIRRLEAEENLR